MGGWRGLLDSSLPSALFLVVYVVDGQQLAPAIWAAVAAGVVIAILRLVRRQSIQQVASGFIGVAFCAWLASRTGRAEDFYLPGLITNVAYGGPDLKTLYVTAGKTLFKIRMEVAGTRR